MSGTTTSALHLRRGSPPDGSDVLVTPESAGWRYSGLRVVTVPADGEVTLDTVGVETVVVPLEGEATVRVGDAELSLAGRASVFEGATDVGYLPPGAAARLHTAAGGRFALCTARTDDASRPAVRIPAADIAVEQRGAGQASRLVRNFGTAQCLDAAAIIACEVITPAGNWSSYPAHKHDEAGPHEAELEEIYYYEIASGPHGEPGFGLHRTSPSPGHDTDVLVEVHDGDVVLVPDGWHGPCAAAPGHDMYYLNVMAGPDPSRRWLISDHPDQAWVRDTWPRQDFDSRISDGRYGT